MKTTPSIDDVKTYGWGIGLDPASCEAFFDYWEASHWETKNRKIKDWKAALRTWKRNKDAFDRSKVEPKPVPIFQQIKSTEALLSSVNKQLEQLPWGVISQKRTQLLEEKKKLSAQLIELHRKAAV